MAQGTTAVATASTQQIPDKRKVGTAGAPALNNVLSATFLSATKDITSMRAQLTTFNALYTSSYLDAMTENDMIFALRNAYESAGMF